MLLLLSTFNWIIISSSFCLLAAFLIYRRIQTKSKESAHASPISYDSARELAYSLLKERYQGHRGYYKSYEREFEFDWSLGTLRKALQPTNPTPNIRYVQRVLDDLKPGAYKVLPPVNPVNKQVA